MLILLAPSETKRAPAAGAPVDLAQLSHADALTPTRERVLTALGKTAATQPARALKALGLSKGQLDELERDRTLRTAPAGPAAEVYTGVLYQHLGLETLSASARARAADSVLVSSALWGVVGLEDRIPAYRLSMGAKLGSLRKTLAATWRGPLADALPDEEGGLVLDMRSGGYAAAWTPKRAALVAIRAITPEGKVISHMAKATRGTVARDVLKARSAPREPEAIARIAGGTLHEPARPGDPWVVEVVG